MVDGVAEAKVIACLPERVCPKCDWKGHRAQERTIAPNHSPKRQELFLKLYTVGRNDHSSHTQDKPGPIGILPLEPLVPHPLLGTPVGARSWRQKLSSLYFICFGECGRTLQILLACIFVVS